MKICASCVSEEFLVMWLRHAHFKRKFLSNLCNTLDVSAEFPASCSSDSLLRVSRAMKVVLEKVLALRKNIKIIGVTELCSDYII